MRAVLIGLVVLSLSGCAVTDKFIKMDEIITKRTECKTVDYITYCTYPKKKHDKVIYDTSS